jgi:hypothetical protein
VSFVIDETQLPVDLTASTAVEAAYPAEIVRVAEALERSSSATKS